MEKPKEKSPADRIRAATKQTAADVSDSILVAWNDLPDWQQDNQYILSSYRPASGSYQGSFDSLFYLHTESINIYSHLLGAVLFILTVPAAYTVLKPRYEAASWQDVYVFSCFFASAIGCLGMSATYHMIMNHSREVSSFGNKLDYIGIVLLIWGSFIPSIYYGFACDPKYINVYWTMVRVFQAVLLV